MLRVLAKFLSAWSADRRGNVAMIFALVLTPVTVLAGGAVDLNLAMNARTRLAQSLDAAALAVGVYISADEAESAEIAADFLNANYPEAELGDVQNLNVSIDNVTDTVTVTAEATVHTLFLGLIGIQTLTVHWESEVQRARQALELVMVLDNTGSMGGSKISNLRDAAHLLTEILFEGADDPDMLHIGLVPFTATVNVGSQYERDWWLDPDALSPIHSENFDPDANRWDLYDTLQNREWTGCVEARQIPHDIEDTTPNVNDPETLFVPYFAPDESYYGSYSNNYISDSMSGYDQRARMMNTPKYTNAWVSSSSRGPQRGCTARPLTPLTNNRNTVDNAISDMIASGTTNIPLGVGWGVRVLSPAMPFTQGVAWDDEETIKAMVVLTDGENYLNGRSNANYSDYSGYGYMYDGRLGIVSSSDSTIRSALNNRTEAACEYAKSLGIRVYTITFQVNSSSTREMMENCASHPSLYFDSPSNEALQNAFQLIAGDLTNLRLSR
jgi:Flp pilus assembly protein TadG